MDSAFVFVHGTRVGRLQRVSDFEDYVFKFDNAWLHARDRPVLGQVFEERRPTPIRSSGILLWFAHLLPQGPWRRYLQRAAALDPSDEDDLALLVAMSPDLPGAVSMGPTTPDADGPLLHPQRAPSAAGKLGFSLAGAQTKLSVKEGEAGLVVAVGGESGSFIAKFHDERFGELPRLEHATTLWARAAGIETHATRLVDHGHFIGLPEGLPVGDGRVLLAARFDRSIEGPIHAEDFGQILDQTPGSPGQYRGSYEGLGRALRVLSPEDVREYVSRVVFAILSGNGDAHLKNWGVIYADRRHPRLSPAYDLVSTITRIPSDDLALELAGQRAFDQVSLRSFQTMGPALGRAERELKSWVLDACHRTLESWRNERESFGFSQKEIDAIERHISRVPLCVESRS